MREKRALDQESKQIQSQFPTMRPTSVCHWANHKPSCHPPPSHLQNGRSGQSTSKTPLRSKLPVNLMIRNEERKREREEEREKERKRGRERERERKEGRKEGREGGRGGKKGRKRERKRERGREEMTIMSFELIVVKN